jgi:3-hydroxyisobutyrate dehydrogenase-like beta-hydroxyacid dehydrogenase
MSEQVGFIGLGEMGLAMARNLLAAGYALTAYNRTRSKAEPLAALGAKIAPTASDAVTAGGVAVTMLADDRALEEVTSEGGVVRALGKGGIHVSMSTISPETTRRLAHYHAQGGSVYVAAPVFGRPEAAAARRLWICTAGPEGSKERIKPLLHAMGQGVFDFGEDAGAANVVKLAGNFLIASAIEALGEALALAQKNGVDRAALADMLAKTLFAAPVYQGYGPTIAARRFMPAGFKLPLGLKDVDLVLSLASQSRTPMPIASLLHDRFIAALAKGRENLDWSAISIGAAEDAGLK